MIVGSFRIFFSFSTISLHFFDANAHALTILLQQAIKFVPQTVCMVLYTKCVVCITVAQYLFFFPRKTHTSSWQLGYVYYFE